MDANSFMAVSSLGVQEDYDNQIVKEVWTEGSSNFTESQSADNCDAVYEKQGSDAYNKCYLAGTSCGGDAKCNEIAKKYAAALVKGYSKDFNSFKKKSNTLAQLGEIGGGLLSGILGKLTGNGQEQEDYYTPEPPKSNTGLYVGLGLLAAVGIGVAIYYGTKK